MAYPVLTPNAWLRWDLISRHVSSLPPGQRILEVGMGQGSVGARLSSMGEYTGVEPDETSRGVARRRVPASAHIIEDVRELEPGERFGLVCAFEVLEHIEDDLGALCSWVAHLEPGGEVLLSVPAHPHRLAAADRAVGHLRRYSRAQLVALAEAAGLEVVRVDSAGFLLGHVLEYGRNRVAERRENQRLSIEEKTALSGRFLQPPSVAGPITQVLTLPFRLLQRAFRRTELGTMWVVRARRPAT